MPIGLRSDPYRNFRFLVEIQGIIEAGFSEASIPDTTSDVIEYREGSDSPTARKLPGLNKYGNVTLKKGVTDLNLYEKWRKPVEEGRIEDARRDMAIIILGEDGITPVSRWEFINAWPSKYKAPDLTAKGNDVAVETLEISHEGMTRVK